MPSPYPPYAPYAEEHANLNGPDDARPSAIKIIEDENLINGLVGHVALVTGCTSGIGPETARAFYAAGMTVYMTARTASKGEPVLSAITSSIPNSKGSLHLLEIDLSSLSSVRAGVSKFLAEQDKLSILVCNAGVMACPWSTTTDGFETQFGTNHLAHFLLLQLLLPALQASSTPSRQSRVVMVSSSGHKNCPARATGDYDFGGGKSYDPWAGYGQSKTANIWTANQLERLYGAEGVHGFSLHPGGIWTPLQKHVTPEKLAEWKKIKGVEKLVKSAAQGAATSVWAATAKHWEGKGGVYLEDCSVALPAAEVPKDAPSLAGHADWAYDEEGEKRLWEDSLELVGLKE